MAQNALNITSTKFDEIKLEDSTENFENDGTLISNIKTQAFSYSNNITTTGNVIYLTFSPSSLVKHNGIFVQASVDPIDEYASGKVSYHFEHFIIISPKWFNDSFPTIIPASPNFSEYCDSSFIIKNNTTPSVSFQEYLTQSSTDVILSSSGVFFIWSKTKPIRTIIKGLVHFL